MEFKSERPAVLEHTGTDVRVVYACDSIEEAQKLASKWNAIGDYFYEAAICTVHITGELFVRDLSVYRRIQQGLGPGIFGGSI